ncbi:hypothetical protein L2E82_26374 [Cichorium intybus]|uniref:Uncharacterized protein n=1 Tax=Cichorium intybus TaxID=13427 RepID=A0ACB9CQC0_CICIN|nr:hypothetical protein L2E82_26374 [Cichorium intybus]
MINPKSCSPSAIEAVHGRATAERIKLSSVVLNDESYHSLTGFLNRKAAEQSAAKSGATDKSVSHPVHETGLCKNLLQEYAQKMNCAIPSYICTKDEKKGRESPFSCTVDIGGIKYIGTAAKTKKEAELKAAKTALLAIQMSAPESNRVGLYGGPH